MPDDKNRPFYNFEDDDDDFLKKNKEKFEININDDDFFNDSKPEDDLFPVSFSPAFDDPDDESKRKYHTGDTGYVDGIDDFAFDFDAIYQNRLQAQKKMQEEAAPQQSRQPKTVFDDFENDSAFADEQSDALPYRVQPPQASVNDGFLDDEGDGFEEEKTRWIESPSVIRENEEKMEKRRRRVRRTRSTTSVLLYIVLVLGASVLLSIFTLTALNDIIGMYKESNQIYVTIPEDASTSEIAKILEQSGVIEQRFTFTLYAKLRGADGKMHGGENIPLDSGLGYDEIITILKGVSTNEGVVTLTFPEGLTMNEIAQKLEENEVCSAEDFIEAAQTVDFGYEFETMIPQNDPNRFYKLEGYIFPDTYDFYIGERPESVVKKFLANFNRKVDQSYYERMEELDMTLDEVIILASIIQKESFDEESMYFVSSVFHNRLNNPGTYPKLQSDVTRDYVNNQIKPYIETPNQTLYDAYNTYACDGLPAGAVCSPGREAIRAALYPENTSYYYFVTDDNNKYYYASTLAQHEANIRTAESVGDVHGTTTGEDE